MHYTQKTEDMSPFDQKNRSNLFLLSKHQVFNNKKEAQVDMYCSSEYHKLHQTAANFVIVSADKTINDYRFVLQDILRTSDSRCLTHYPVKRTLPSFASFEPCIQSNRFFFCGRSIGQPQIVPPTRQITKRSIRLISTGFQRCTKPL